MPKQVFHPLLWDASLASQQTHACTSKDQKLTRTIACQQKRFLLAVDKFPELVATFPDLSNETPRIAFMKGLQGEQSCLKDPPHLYQGQNFLTLPLHKPSCPVCQGSYHPLCTPSQPAFPPSQVGSLGMGEEVRERGDWADPTWAEKPRYRNSHL